MKKKGQITIFVIIAIVIVVSIAVIFIFAGKPGAAAISPDRPDTIKSYIDGCINDATKEAISSIIAHGGFLAPTSYLKFDNTEVLWLCYTPFNEQLCTNKHPMLGKEAENEISNYIKPKINSCFSNVKNRLANYNYNEEPLKLDARILPGRVYINATKKITYSKTERTITLQEFDASTNSALYDFIRIAIEAVNQEVSCDCPDATCNADIFGLNRENREFEIRRFVSGRNEKVYTIKEILTGQEFNFAVRNCVRLP